MTMSRGWLRTESMETMPPFSIGPSIIEQGKYHEWMNTFLCVYKGYRENCHENKVDPSFQEFAKLSTLSNTGIVTSLFAVSDLIEKPDASHGSLSEAEIKEGSVTPWGAFKILDHMLAGSPTYRDTTKRHQKLIDLTGIDDKATVEKSNREKVSRYKNPERRKGNANTKPAQLKTTRIGSLVLYKGYKLLDPKTGEIIDPETL